MNFQQYEALLRTVELGSFTKAALALGYTQSGISHMLAALEKECGCTLLYRDRGGVRLSSEGAILLPYFRAVAQHQRELNEKLDELRGLETGLISIGTITSVSVQWLPSIIADFHAAHPSIDFELHYGEDYYEIEKWIDEGCVDCGFVALPTAIPLDCRFLQRDPFMAVLPPQHALAGREKLQVADLAPYPFVRLAEGNDNEISSIFSRYEIEPDVRLTAWDNQTVVALVSKGLGVSLLPRLLLDSMPYDFISRPIDPPVFRDLALATRPGTELSAATAAFVECAASWITNRP